MGLQAGREQKYNKWQIAEIRQQMRLQELFWKQVRGCEMEVGTGPGRVLKWGVPAGKRDVGTGETLHDDLLISAALCTVLDGQVWGSAVSAIIPFDPIGDLKPAY